MLIGYKSLSLIFGDLGASVWRYGYNWDTAPPQKRKVGLERFSKMGKTGYYFITEAKNKNPYFMRVSAIGLGYIMSIIGTYNLGTHDHPGGG